MPCEYTPGTLRVLKSFNYGGCTFILGDAHVYGLRVIMTPLCRDHCSSCIWDTHHFIDNSGDTPKVYSSKLDSGWYQDAETEEPLTSLEDYLIFIPD